MPPLRGLLSVPVAFGVTESTTSKEPPLPTVTGPPEATQLRSSPASEQTIVPVTPETLVTDGVP